jgi:hypothetical protein
VRFQSGPGFYVLGCTLGFDGGALAILERKHVRLTPTPQPIIRGTYVPQKTLDEAERDAWQSHFMLRHVETFAADRPRSEFVALVRTLVGAPPLDGETSIMLDVTDLGDTLREPFYQGIGRENYVTPVTLSREATTAQPGVTALADVRGAIISLHESGRLKVADKIPHRNEVARTVEHAARGDELPRLALAIGIACHHAKGGWAFGPWPGRKPPKPGTKEFHELDAWTMFRRELERAREDQDEDKWLPRWMGR